MRPNGCLQNESKSARFEPGYTDYVKGAGLQFQKGTGKRSLFSRLLSIRLLDLTTKGMAEWCAAQEEVLGD